MDQVKDEVDSSSEEVSSPRDMEVKISPKRKEKQKEKAQTEVKDMVGHRRYVLELYGQRYQAEKFQSRDASSEKVAILLPEHI